MGNSTAQEAEIAWIDLETNGVDTRTGEKLLQLAIILTDKDFNEIDTLEAKFYFTAEEASALRDHAIEYVKDMHDKTGLWLQVTDKNQTTSYEEFDAKLLAWMQQYQPKSRTLRFGGNSVTLDREFMREFLPTSYEYLSYQNVDMTSVEIFLMGTDNRSRYEKKLTHEALDDIRESLAQAHYHRELSKVPF